MERRVKLGDVEFSVVVEEKPKDIVTITDHQVENGQDVSDHVKQESSIIDIIGVMVGDDASKKLSQLKKYQREGKLLTYAGRNLYPSMAIQTIDRNHGKTVRNGFEFNITLKSVRVTTAKTVEITVVNPVTKKADKKVATKVKPKVNNGKQQPQKKTTSTPYKAPPIIPQIQAAGMYQGGLIHQEKASPVANMKAIKNTYKHGNPLGIYQGGLN